MTYYKDGGGSMAEFCRDCFLEIHEMKKLPSYLTLSRDLDFCEGCGQWKHVVEQREISYIRLHFVVFEILHDLVLAGIGFIKRKIDKKRGKLK